jgi:hypothetical protein
LVPLLPVETVSLFSKLMAKFFQVPRLLPALFKLVIATSNWFALVLATAAGISPLPDIGHFGFGRYTCDKDED